MRIITPLLCLCILFSSCNSGEKIPDVSHIKVELATERFEKDFFKLDSAALLQGLQQLQVKYPYFFNDFSEKILGVEGDGNAGNAIQSFLLSYRSIYDSTQQLFGDFSQYESEIKGGLQIVKYYFPNYKLPSKIITFIGPMDASYKTAFGLQGDILTNNAIGIGLQLHMGAGFSFYKSEQGMQLYPDYIARNFTPYTITVNALRNITDDLYPEKLEDKTLVQQMVEKGKRLYLLHRFLPRTPEHLLIGYSSDLVKQCYQHEKEIWNMFVQNNVLQQTDENVIKNYIGESPKTQELGDASPGNIGSWAGYQIIKKYMQENSSITLQQLIAKDADEIFQAAKYKP